MITECKHRNKFYHFSSVCPQFVSFDTPKEAAIHVRLPEHKEYVSMFLEKVKSKNN